MEKEFKLSENMKTIHCECGCAHKFIFTYPKVKEFIKRLKDKGNELNKTYYIGNQSPFHDLMREIDKLAGDELNGKEHTIEG